MPGLNLLHGDCLQLLESLPESSVDCVLTDPPYGSGGLFLGERQQTTRIKYQVKGTRKVYPEFFGDAKDQRGWFAWSQRWLYLCWRVAKTGAPLLMFCDWRQLPTATDAIQASGWTWRGVLAWDKKPGRPQRGRFRQQCEFVIFASKGAFQAAHERCLPGCFSYCVEHNKLHVTAKPVGLIKDLLEISAEGATVLDPFMGAGGIGQACIETGRGYIGMELSPEYYEISRQRLTPLWHGEGGSQLPAALHM